MSRGLTPEREIDGDALRLDLWCEPEPTKLSALKPLGLIYRIVCDGPCAFEFFHDPPSLDETLSSLRKAFFLRRPATLPARADEPWLWIIAGGRPTQVISAFGLTRKRDWPRGVYGALPGLRLRLIVTNELPQRPETLLLRCLGAGKTLRQAQRELREIGIDHPISRIIVPLMVRLHLEQRQDPTSRTREDEEFVMETQDIYEAWRQRIEAHGRDAGLAEGQIRALLAVLEARRIEVSADQAERIRSCRDLELLESWLRRAVDAERCADVLT